MACVLFEVKKFRVRFIAMIAKKTMTTTFAMNVMKLAILLLVFTIGTATMFMYATIALANCIAFVMTVMSITM